MRAANILYTVLSGMGFSLQGARRWSPPGLLNYALPADMVGLQGALMREMQHSVEALTPLVACAYFRAAKLWDLYSRLPSLAFDITWLAARGEQLVRRTSGQSRSAYRAASVPRYLLSTSLPCVREVRAWSGIRSIQFPFTQQHRRRHAWNVARAHQQDAQAPLHERRRSAGKTASFEMVDRTALAAMAGSDVGKELVRGPSI